MINFNQTILIIIMLSISTDLANNDDDSLFNELQEHENCMRDTEILQEKIQLLLQQATSMGHDLNTSLDLKGNPNHKHKRDIQYQKAMRKISCAADVVQSFLNCSTSSISDISTVVLLIQACNQMQEQEDTDYNFCIDLNKFCNKMVISILSLLHLFNIELWKLIYFNIKTNLKLLNTDSKFINIIYTCIGDSIETVCGFNYDPMHFNSCDVHTVNQLLIDGRTLFISSEIFETLKKQGLRNYEYIQRSDNILIIGIE